MLLFLCYFVVKMTKEVSVNIVRYEPRLKKVWDDFVSEAKNSSFLFRRDFMEYHQDRFEDFSLLLYNNKELVAILPANIKDNKVFSHQGLTYGGLVVLPKLRIIDYYSIFRELLFYLHNAQINSLYLKEIPYFYNSIPNDEWKHLAYITNAELYKRDLCAVINLKKKHCISKSIIRDAKTGEKHIDSFERTTNFKGFWEEVLIPEMFAKYQTTPVHSVDEIVLLSELFPDNIHLYCVFKDNKIIAGTVLFIFNNVVHVQYISGLQRYKKLGILDFLFYDLITNKFKSFCYFDFGISNEQNGKKTNKGLLFWKESFGARGISQDFYEFSTANYFLLDQMYL